MITKNSKKRVKIPFNKIVLTEAVHKKPMKINMYIVKLIKLEKFDTSRMVFPVRELENGDYSLLSNRSFYEVFKRAKVRYAYVEIYDVNNRIEFLKNQGRLMQMKLKNIQIKDAMKATKPSDYKIDREIDHYKEHGYFTDTITVKRIRDKIYLVDGYSRYMASMQLGVRIVDVIEI